MHVIAPKVRTCLWFADKGLEAARFYISLLPESHLDRHYNIDDIEPVAVEFTLAGAPMMIINGGPGYPLTAAASISVMTDDQDETDRLWSALTAQGGEESRCGWLKDRYGVSWQIIPRRLLELINHTDVEAATRAREAMLAMTKIDISALEAAFDSA